MKLNSKVKTLLLSLVVVNILCTTGYFWGSNRESDRQERVKKLQVSLSGIEQGKDEIEEHFNYLQGKVMQATLQKSDVLLGKQDINPRSLEKLITESAIDNQVATSKEKEDAAKEIEEIKSLADQIVLTKRDLYQSMKDTLLLDKEAFEKVHTVFVNKLIPQRNEIISKLNNLRKNYELMLDQAYRDLDFAANTQLIFILLDLIVSIILVLSIINKSKNSIEKPFREILNKLETKSPLPVPNNELGIISEHINKLNSEINEIQKTLNTLALGGIEKQVDIKNFNENLQTSLISIRRKFQQFAEDKILNEAESKNLQTKIKSLEKAADEITQFHQDRFINFIDTFASCEISLMGQLIGANNIFTDLLEVERGTLRDLSYEQVFCAHPDSKAIGSELWKTISSGKNWNGKIAIQSPKNKNIKDPIWLIVTAVPIRNILNEIEKYIISGFNISALQELTNQLKLENESTEKKVVQIEKNLVDQQAQISSLSAEKEVLQKSYLEQKKLQERLAVQQSALLNLTRSSNFKEGNIKDTLRTVTEYAALVLGEKRASLWLFTNRKTKLHCLDIYESESQKHKNSIEFSSNDIPEMFVELEKDEIWGLESVAKSDLITNFNDLYLKKHNISAFLSTPIHLGGIVIGAIMVEHIADEKVTNTIERKWDSDEQIFMVSLAELTSLTLEQGNRKAMEEELRVTLEESQALDEELRQNAEEIEATNEEMRRTQIELRGQINALNNAAIVSEANLQGLITYANNEFLNVYKFKKAQVVGKNHSIIKSDEHKPEFFDNLWKTITSGQVWSGEVKNKALDGTIIWVSLTVTPVLGLDGVPFKFISVSFNITRQKLQSQRIKEALQVALEQEEALRNSASTLMVTNDEMRRTQLELTGQIQALNNSSLVLETDMAGNIRLANKAFLSLTHFEIEDIIGHNFSIIKSGRQAEALYNDLWKTVSQGKTWRAELELTCKDKETFYWVVITSNPVMDENGDPTKVIHVLFDISDQKKQEFRLKKQQSALLEINSHPSVKEGNVKKAFQVIARIGMETLKVSRASIWLFIENGRKVRCSSVFQRDSHEHAEGTILDTEMYPTYFKALERDRLIDAYDAINDPRTKELAFSVFKPQGISSVMDTSVRQGEKMVGILSFESTDIATREWTLDEQAFATSLADTISLVLEQKERQLNSKLKQAYAQLEEANKEMIRQKQELEETTQGLAQSIKYAKRIQTNILPSKDYLDKHIGRDNYFFVHRQRDHVGGDFYWFDQIGGKQVFVVGDGTGHGVPGAFLTLIGYLLLNQIVVEKGLTTPGEILYYLHKGVRQALKQDDEDARQTSRDGMDVAVCTFDLESKMVEFAGANLPLYYYKDWEIHEVKPTKKSIGGEQLEEERIFANHAVQLKIGDAFYMYTDGFVDQFGGPEEKRFSTKRFKDLILRTQHESMSTQRAMLNMEWKDWKEDREQLDDITVFGYRVV